MERTSAVERYAAGYGDVLEALEDITEDELDRAPAGGWSARWVVHHLADSEAAAYVRLCRLLAEQPEMGGNDEEALAQALDYDRPIAPSLSLFRAAREAGCALLEALVPQVPEPHPLDDWLRIYAGHALEHADQIRRARRGEP